MFRKEAIIKEVGYFQQKEQGNRLRDNHGKISHNIEMKKYARCLTLTNTSRSQKRGFKKVKNHKPEINS